MKMSHFLLGLTGLLACASSPAFAWPWSDNGFINRSSSSSSTTTTTTIVVRPYNAFSDMSANAIVSTSGSGSNQIPLSLMGIGVGPNTLTQLQQGLLPGVAPVAQGVYPIMLRGAPSPYPYYGYGYAYPQPCIPYPDCGYYPSMYYPTTAWYPPPPPPQYPPQRR